MPTYLFYAAHPHYSDRCLRAIRPPYLDRRLQWSKKTDTELAVHVPLLIRVPWKQASLGWRTTVKAELIDMYRTLADLAGLSSQAPLVEDSVQGTSLAPVFDAPGSPGPLAEKRAYSQIGRCDCGMYPDHAPGHTDKFVKECGGNACAMVPLGQFDYMGYSVRTNTARFTAWVPFDNTTMRVDWNRTELMRQEYFNLSADTGRDFDFPGYSLNLAQDPCCAAHAGQLLEELRATVDTWY